MRRLAVPDLVAHLAAGYLIARAATRKGRLYALLLAPLGLLPDIDAVFALHRWVTHSIFIPVAMLITYLFLRRRFRRAELLALAALLYAVHLAMDIFTAPLPILWPALGTEVGVSIGILGIRTPTTLGIEPRVELVTQPAVFTMHRVEGPVLGPVGAILLVLALGVELGAYLYRYQ